MAFDFPQGRVSCVQTELGGDATRLKEGEREKERVKRKVAVAQSKLRA